MEFGIGSTIKFLRQDVEIDVSATSLRDLEFTSSPRWEERTVYLNVLIEGKASLYMYQFALGKKFLYKTPDSEVEQLVYKRYTRTGSGNLLYNRAYRQTLLNAFADCSQLQLDDFEELDYQRDDMVKLVSSYNACTGEASHNYDSSRQTVDFNLKLKGGLNFTSVSTAQDDFDFLAADFGSDTGYRFGIEGEFIFPFNNGKWSGFMELAKNAKFESFDEVTNISISRPTQRVDLEIDYLEVILGIRHYMMLDDHFKLSLHAGYSYNMATTLKLAYEIALIPIDSKLTSGNVFIGTGVHYDDFALEARLQLGKDTIVQKNARSHTADFSNFNLVLAYTIL